MNKVVLLLFSGLLLLAGCQSDSKSGNESKDQQTTNKIVIDDPKTTDAPGELSMRERGLRKKDPERVPDNIQIPEPTPQKWAFLTSDLWHYVFALTVTDVPDKNPYEGYWIDFHDDGTYEKGIYDDVTVEGVFTFNNDNKRLRIYPTKGDDKIREWEIKTNGDVIIFVGTNTFGNNSEQIKLERAKAKPLRKVQ